MEDTNYSLEDQEKKIKELRGHAQHFDADIKIFGEKSTLTQIVFLLAFVRDMIQQKKSGDIVVSVGKHMTSDVFSFTVNDQEVPQMIAEKRLEIN